MLIEEPVLLEPSWSPVCAEGLPALELREGRYTLRFAQSPEELDAALRLRFQVFNLELGEGLEVSFHTGRDQDEFDEACHHLIVTDTGTGRVVGTYRVQTASMARWKGFYSAGEFSLPHLPREVLEQGVELGRACIAKEHRNTRVLFLLWKGIAAYMIHNNKRYLFGCCSLTSQDPREALGVMRILEREGYLHNSFHVPPLPGFECRPEAHDSAEPAPARIPALFNSYLRFGAKVCGPPALDRAFKTIDFLVLLDVDQISPLTRSIFFGG